MPLEPHHETYCGHGVSYDDECQQCEDVWIEDTVTWLRRRARKLGYRMVPMYRESLPLTFGRVEERGVCAIAQALDLIGRDSITDHDLAKLVIDNESEIKAAVRWFDSMFPRYTQEHS